MSIVRLVARPMLASMFIAGGINALRNTDMLARRAKPVIDRMRPLMERASAALPVEIDDEMLVRANGVIHVTAGAMLATGRSPRLASLVLAGTLVPTTAAGHRFWEESDPMMRANQRNHFLKNLAMAGGLLLAGVDTDGKPSLAWRARSQARRARGKLTLG